MLIFLPEALRLIFSMVMSVGFNLFIAGIFLKFSIDNLSEGDLGMAAILGIAGLLIGGASIYYAQGFIRRQLKESKEANENKDKS